MYVPSTRKIIFSYDVVFDVSFSSALAYTSRPYSQAMALRPYVTYKPYATSSRKKNGDIIRFSQFEEVNLLSETCEDAESDDRSSEKYDDNSIMSPLFSLEESNALDSDESDDEPMSREML